MAGVLIPVEHLVRLKAGLFRTLQAILVTYYLMTVQENMKLGHFIAPQAQGLALEWSQW